MTMVNYVDLPDTKQIKMILIGSDTDPDVIDEVLLSSAQAMEMSMSLIQHAQNVDPMLVQMMVLTTARAKGKVKK